MSRYDAAGYLEATLFNYDAGGRLYTYQDVGDQEDWISKDVRYIASDALEAEASKLVDSTF